MTIPEILISDTVPANGDIELRCPICNEVLYGVKLPSGDSRGKPCPHLVFLAVDDSEVDRGDRHERFEWYQGEMPQEVRKAVAKEGNPEAGNWPSTVLPAIARDDLIALWVNLNDSCAGCQTWIDVVAGIQVNKETRPIVEAKAEDSIYIISRPPED